MQESTSNHKPTYNDTIERHMSHIKSEYNRIFLETGALPTIYSIELKFMEYTESIEISLSYHSTFDFYSSSVKKPLSVVKCFRYTEKIYCRICPLIIPHFSRPSKRYLQPLFYFYIDFPYTGEKKSLDRMARHRVAKLKDRLKADRSEQTPHIHGILLVRPATAVRLEEHLPDLESHCKRAFPRVLKELNIERVDPDRLHKKLDYQAKFLKKVSSQDGYIDWYGVLPKTLDEPTYVLPDWQSESVKRMKEDREFRRKHVINHLSAAELNRSIQTSETG